jgi:site-specific DNA recombinase
MTLLCRVEINPDRIEIHISRHRLASLLARQSIDPTMQDHKLDRDADDVVTLVTPARLKRVGREMRMLVENSDDQTAADPSLLRIIARAHDIQERLIRNTEMTVHDIAREEHVSAAYIYNLLRLPWLAPDITTAIVNGRQPQQLNAMILMRRASRLPADWAEQRMQLGFR